MYKVTWLRHDGWGNLREDFTWFGPDAREAAENFAFLNDGEVEFIDPSPID